MNSNYSSLNDYISSIKSELETRFSLMHNKLISYIDENISIINSRLLDNNKELNERINMLDTQVRSIINLNDMIKENREELDIKIKEEISSLKAYVDAKSDSINMMLNEQRSFSNDIVKRLTTLEESIRDLEARMHKVNQHLDNVINNNNELKEEISSISKSIDSNIDTKVSLAIDKIHTKINNLTEDLANIKQELDTKLIYIDEVVRRVDDILATLKASTNGKNGNGTYNNENAITLEQFRIDFDRMLAESSSSIGWVELASIRERMCRRYNISAHEFYTLVSQLIEHFNSRYELSSGGQEGIVIRGLIHGFVRRV
jgi:chromosome segregation ATPase